MKKHLLTIFGLALSAGAFFAQDLEITLKNSATVISGETHEENIENNNGFYVEFDVYNRSGSTQEFVVTRQRISVPGDWTDDLCWGHSTDQFGGVCYTYYAENPWVTPDAVEMADDEHGIVKVGFFPNTQTAPATYRYYFGTVSDPKMDSVDVEINSVAGISDVTKTISLSVSPNPASSFVAVKANTNDAQLKIVDVLGNVIINEPFKGSRNLNVAEFKNGVYFIIIEGNGIQSINRKFVVRH